MLEALIFCPSNSGERKGEATRQDPSALDHMSNIDCVDCFCFFFLPGGEGGGGGFYFGGLNTPTGIVVLDSLQNYSIGYLE